MIGPTRLTAPRGRLMRPVRHLRCERYQQCLLSAAKADWDSFTCSPCELCEVRGEDRLGPRIGDDEHPVDLRSPEVTTWRPLPAHVRRCQVCGQACPNGTIWRVEGLACCLLCRPDVGAPAHPRWLASLRTQRAQGPLVSCRDLELLTGTRALAVLRGVQAAGIVRYVLGPRKLLVSAAAVGLECDPWPELAKPEISAGTVLRLLLLRSPHAAASRSIVRGRSTVPHAELLTLLAVGLTYGGEEVPHAD